MASVTVGLPVYNGAAHLDGALASLCAQTFKDLKILVSDNASTDETPEIIKKWAARDGRVEYHRQPHNIGAVANFEWVLNNADSRWFCFAAYDDLWSPNYVDALHGAITEKPDLTLAAPRMVTMFEDGREDNTFPFAAEIRAGNNLPSSIAACLRKAHSGWFYGVFDRAALRSLFRETESFSHPWGHDFIIILPPIFAGAVTGDDRAVYYKRQTPLSDERYRPKTGKDQFAIYRDVIRECFKALKKARLSPLERVSLLPRLIKYARKIQKPKRMIKAVIRDALKRSRGLA